MTDTQQKIIDESQLHDAAWSRLERAADDRAHPMRLHTVATVDADGFPDARILIVRGADRRHAHLWYHTDIRSRKVKQLNTNHWARAVCYDPRDGTQIRASGGVTVHCDDDLAWKHWQQIDLAVRRAYGLPHVPGLPLPHPDFRMRDHAAQAAADEANAGRENFAVLQLSVNAIEWLQVRDIGDQRAIMRADDNWQPQLLMP